MHKSPKRRCVCGHSKTFPVCDFSHRSENWKCAVGQDEVAPWCFVAGPHNLNMAEKLAAEFNGVAIHLVEGRVVTERCVIITEGTDIETIKVHQARVEAPSWSVACLGLAGEIVAPLFPDAAIQEISSDSPLESWAEIQAACLAGFESAKELKPRALKSAFISHAVNDEAKIFAPVEYLRKNYSADLFLCADSIASGTLWQAEIVDSLRQRDLFILILSSASKDSAFCAFEIGYAMALNKPVSLISLDGTTPAVFAQHLQMDDVRRHGNRKPWLDEQESLLEILLQLLDA